MASRHYGPHAFVVHVWGPLPHQHLWKVYGTESVARTQATRMEQDYWVARDGSIRAQTEIFPLSGQGANG